MTYCNQPQWLSAYTYEGVRKRLLDENPGFHTLAAQPTSSVVRPESQVHVAATVNLTKATGEIRYVTPVQRALPQIGPSDRAVLITRDASGRELRRTPGYPARNDRYPVGSGS